MVAHKITYYKDFTIKTFLNTLMGQSNLLKTTIKKAT